MKKNKIMDTKNVHCKQTFHNDITPTEMAPSIRMIND